MAAKPGIAIVGAGNLAHALALSLRSAGYRIDEVVVRAEGRSLQKAKSLARKIGARASIVSAARLAAPVVWFCVPDSEIARAARLLAPQADWKRKIALHSSGALSSDELNALRSRGAAAASAHPLMTFVHRMFSRQAFAKSSSNSEKSKSILAKVPFAIEGDASAVRLARRIVRDLGARAYSIGKKDKAAYHAWGTFASPLFTALLATTERVAALAGTNHREVRRRMLPILRQTLENYAAFGAAAGFSGPILRGDVETVERHLSVLRRDPVTRDVYLALVQAALQYLPAKNQSRLKRALQSGMRR